MKNIILIGMPGSGKSTVGVLLAKALGYGFLDTDLTIQQREGTLLQDILDSRGIEAFLDAEEEALCSVDCTDTVIAPGGSAVCRAAAMARLKALGRIVYLKVDPQVLAGRLRNISTRGIAMAPGQTIQSLYEERAALYERYADYVVEAGEDTLEETVSAVLRSLVEA
jgi:shikimate kinase